MNDGNNNNNNRLKEIATDLKKKKALVDQSDENDIMFKTLKTWIVPCDDWWQDKNVKNFLLDWFVCSVA